ncbi:hypothetical protein BGZ46_002434 [Entomortierella lignicola]|nr:hypothetical protein BGZ46_002434 [Entomortierella lignicola]
MPSHSLKSLFKGHGTPSSQPPSDNKPNLNISNNHPNATETQNHTTPSKEHRNTHVKDTQAPKASNNTSNSISTTPPSISRKRSILLNMMLPPEAPPVDAKLAIPPVILFPPSLEPEGGRTTILDRELKVEETETKTTIVSKLDTTTSESTSTSRSLRSWIRRGSDNADNSKSAETVTVAGSGQITRRNNGDKGNQELRPNHADRVLKNLDVESSHISSHSTTSTTIRTWFSKFSPSNSHVQEGSNSKIGISTETKKENPVGNDIGALPETEKQAFNPIENQQQQQLTTTSTSPSTRPNNDGSVTTVQQQEIIHQEIHQKTRNVALVNVNLSMQDIFGFGKVMELTLAMFHAHGAFLRRHPFWLQCVLMTWEGLIVLLLVWGVLRVVGLAEVIVWGADDLVRGTLSVFQTISRTAYRYFSV